MIQRTLISVSAMEAKAVPNSATMAEVLEVAYFAMHVKGSYMLNLGLITVANTRQTLALNNIAH